MPEIPEALLGLLIDIGALLLIVHFIKRIKQRREEPEKKKPAPPVAKRGIPGLAKNVIAVILLVAIGAFTAFYVNLPQVQVSQIFPKGELYGHYSSNSVQRPDGSWVATINPKITFSEASKVPVKGNVKTIFETTGAVKTTTRKDDLAYHEDPYGPEGNPDTPRCTNCIVPGSPWMGLVGKYVSTDGKNISYFNFKADRKVSVTFPKDGNVYFTVNEVLLPHIPWAMEDNTGGFTVTVKTAK